MNTAADSLETGACNAAECTFREAILAANDAPGLDTIEFDIPGAGPHTIQIVASMPTISSPVTIDGTSEPDYEGTPVIEYDGVGSGFNGLTIGAPSTVLGLAINNWGTGVHAQATSGVVLQGNYIGTNVTGTASKLNTIGVQILGGSGHVIGGPGAGNVISGNFSFGLIVNGVTSATIQGNRIGTNAAGTAAVPNPTGITVFASTALGVSDVEIGGAAPGEGNLVSGNSGDGIRIDSAGGPASGTQIYGNLIGTNAAGTSGIANGQSGIEIIGSDGATTDTAVGGTDPREANTIAFNGSDGITIPGVQHVRNAIRGNSIHSNGGLGIGLGANGVTANDEDDVDTGANELQNFPVLMSVTSGGDQTIIEGSLDSTPNMDFTLEFFVNAACDASGSGEGATFIGSAPAATSGDGDGTFTVELSGAQTVGEFVTATATDPAGNTSEFSACKAVEAGGGPQSGATFTVNTAEDATPADAGCSVTDCTLREAIEAANLSVGADTIEFGIPGPAPHTIAPTTALPAIAGEVTIDGTTQPGSAGTPIVEIDGSAVTGGGDGLFIAAGSSTVRGLVVNGFAGSGSVGIVVAGGGNVVEGNFVGTDATGTLARPNHVGIEVRSSGNTIGGTTAAARNVISGNSGTNILISGEAADGNHVEGNYIGPDKNGTAAISPGAGVDGVLISGGADDNFIGGLEATGNVISGNGGRGVLILDADTSGNRVDANYIGLDAVGMTVVRNGIYGVQIQGTGTNFVRQNLIAGNASGVTIGGGGVTTANQSVTGNGMGVNEAGEVVGQLGAGVAISNSSGHFIASNTIAGHTDAGILIHPFGGEATGITIRGNSIKQNAGLGIDLVTDADPRGVTPNDAGDADEGPNDFQNFPVLTAATTSGATTTVEGTLNSTLVTDFQVDFFGSTTCDSSGHGEGAFFLGTTTVATDEGGNVEFSQLLAGVAAGTQVTATATGPSGTSEFSACVEVATRYLVNSNTDNTPDGCDGESCTLREAIEAANGDGTFSRLEFDLGIFPQINLGSALPAITAPVVIDGTTEPNGSIVTLDGSLAGGVQGLALVEGSDGSTIKGLEIANFPGNEGITVRSGDNTIVGNLIWAVGTGIQVGSPTATGNDIGGRFDEGEGNRIWDFVEWGVFVNFAGTGNHISGNTIGLDPDDVGDGGETGIRVNATPGTVIGHDLDTSQLPDYNRANVVVAGFGEGIRLSGATSGTRVVGNFVGIDRARTRTDLGNSGPGIWVVESSNGNQLGTGNVIAHNGSHGIDVRNSSLNRISANSIHSNDGLGISFTSANEDTSAPELLSAIQVGSTTTVETRVTGIPGRTYWVEFFDNTACDPSGFGEGETYRGFATVTLTDESEVFTLPRGGWQAGDFMTTTLTDSTNGETSELSNCITVADGDVVQPGPTFTVNSSSDDQPFANEGCTIGECTLREAIEAANLAANPNTIEFDMPERIIRLRSELPSIDDTVTIAGTTQGAAGVEVNATDTFAAFGLRLANGSDGSTVMGLEIRNLFEEGAAGIEIRSSGNTIAGNTLHSLPTGIYLTGEFAVDNVIGGSESAGEGNSVWGFSEYGIRLDEAGTGNRLSGNTIGLDTASNPNAGFRGIVVEGSPGAVIGSDVGPAGTPDLDLGNVVVGASTEGGLGISISGGGSTGTRVTGNFVGVDRAGSAQNLGNAIGIGVFFATGNQLGPGNTVARNLADGIQVADAASFGNRITANSIHSNGDLGIRLINGGNGGIAAPDLFGATLSGGTTTITGEHNGTPNFAYSIEVFANAACDSLETGEGQTFLGRFPFFPETEFGEFEIDVEGVEVGDVITATITDVTEGADNTSQFSDCATVELADQPTPAPVLFGAVVDALNEETNETSLGVAGLVDSGQPGAGQAFDVEFFSATACDPLALQDSLGTGDDFVTNDAGIAGFAKDGLDDVPIGTIVVAIARRGEASSTISNCVVADRNNTSWHTAFGLDPMDDETGALRAMGEARWFKVPILPNSRVDVSLTDLPADYDLIVFSDIQQAYERLVGTDVDPTIGPNLAITDLNRAGAETQTDVFNTSQYDASAWDPTNWDPNLNTSVFSPSQWSPSQWSPSQWSASQWSPSQWSPSQWSPSQWSPSQWSPSQWSPSQWSPSQWSPSQWSSSNPADPRAFSAAQTASLLAVSAGPGTGDEGVSVNTWNNTGHFYVRVQGKNGSFDPASEFSLSVRRQGNLCEGVLDQASTPVAETGLGSPETLILRDSRRLATGSFMARLQTLADRPDVDGHIVDVDADLTVRSLNAQADLRASCPFAKNLVASAIKRMVDAYRKAYPSIEYAVVVGDDNVIPFFRYPDPALIGNETLYVPPVRDDTTSQASLRLGYILSDDFLASSTSIALHGTLFPVPDLSIGRLVETPQEIGGMLDAYLGTAGGVVPTPTSSLVTGYDFLTDAADEIAGHLREGIGATGANRTLITDQTVSPGLTTDAGTAPTRDRSWTADDLRNALLDPARKDIVFLAGHFSANDALAADYRTNVLTTELAASSTNLENAIVFSAGCHAGYNIVNDHATTWTEPLDWAQAFAQKRATLISGTGYQYGDTDFLAHGERIYAEFARQLRVTTQEDESPEAVAVGRALLRAKQVFLESTPGLTSLDEKSLLQTTLFGLPMLSVNLPGDRIFEAPEETFIEETELVGPGPGRDLGLRAANVVDLGATLTLRDKLLTHPDGNVTATWLEGPNDVAVRPTQPILPLRTVDVTPPDPATALRGVAFRGGTYVDTGGTIPLTGAPATELRGIHAPFFTDVFFPTQPWTVNYFGALGGGSTFLHVTPVQHRSESPTMMTRRAFDDLDLRLFYSGNIASYCPGVVPLRTPPCPTQPGLPPPIVVTPALAAPPTVTGVETSFADGSLTFKARVVGDPVAGIQTVWVTWTIPPGPGLEGEWDSLDLTRDAADPALWTGTLPLGAGVDPGDVHFAVQAVNGVGRVTIDDNVGALYRPGSIPGIGAVTPGAPDPAPTELAFTTPPPSSVTFGETFQVTVVLTSEGSPVSGKLVRVGIGASGIPAPTDASGQATVELRAALTPGSYAVTASFSGDATNAPAGASATISVTPRPTTLTLGGTLGPSTQGNPPAIHAILEATPSTPLHQRTVFVIIKGTGPVNLAVTEVFAGKTDPQGRIDIPSALLASLPAGNYAVDAYFNGVNVPGVLVLPPDSPQYAPSSAHATLGLHPRPLDLLAQAVEVLRVLAAQPGKLGDKAEDALAKVESAIRKLNRSKPDRQGALGDLEGAAGDLEAAVKSRLLTAAQAKPILDLITGAAWVTAVEARQRAIDRGAKASKIAAVTRAIDTGNARWAAARYKEAIARYKEALAKAESA